MQRKLCFLAAALTLSACFDPAKSDDDTDGASSSGSGGSDNGDSGNPGATDTSDPTTGGPVMTGTGGNSETGPVTGSEGSEGSTDEGGSDDNADSDSSGGQDVPPSSCGGTWHPWLTSSFRYPDGDVIGTSEFPGGPWGVAVGAPELADEQLTTVGSSQVVTSHIDMVPFSDTRIRFAVTFEGSDNEIDVHVDADETGAGGWSISMDASDGSITISDNGTETGSALLGPLELDTEYFVELEVDGGAATGWVSTEGYATVPGSVLVETIDAIANGVGAGRWASVELSDGGGGAPHLAELEFSVCDTMPPDREQVFFDSFDRPNSASLGSPDFPAGVSWTEGSPANASITGNRLRTGGNNPYNTAQPSVAPVANQSRLTAIVELETAGASTTLMWTACEGFCLVVPPPMFLGVEVMNDGAGASALLLQTPDAATSVGSLVAGEDYFVTVAVDGPYGVASIRSASFTGPVVAASQSSQLVGPNAGYVALSAASGSEQSQYSRVDDLELSWYGGK